MTTHIDLIPRETTTCCAACTTETDRWLVIDGSGTFHRRFLKALGIPAYEAGWLVSIREGKEAPARFMDSYPVCDAHAALLPEGWPKPFMLPFVTETR